MTTESDHLPFIGGLRGGGGEGGMEEITHPIDGEINKQDQSCVKKMQDMFLLRNKPVKFESTMTSLLLYVP